MCIRDRFINGLRVTDADTMEVAEMVLGKVNKSLVQLVESLGVDVYKRQPSGCSAKHKFNIVVVEK